MFLSLTDAAALDDALFGPSEQDEREYCETILPLDDEQPMGFFTQPAPGEHVPTPGTTCDVWCTAGILNCR